MKTFLTHLKASLALDRGPLEGPEQHSPASPQVRQVHDKLLRAQPRVPLPEDLHFQIMAAVRQPEPKVPARRGWRRSASRATAFGCALGVLVLCILAWRHAGPREQVDWNAQAGVDSTLQVLGSLDQELNYLNQDLKGTAEQLLASLP